MIEDSKIDVKDLGDGQSEISFSGVSVTVERLPVLHFDAAVSVGWVKARAAHGGRVSDDRNDANSWAFDLVSHEIGVAAIVAWHPFAEDPTPDAVRRFLSLVPEGVLDAVVRVASPAIRLSDEENEGREERLVNLISWRSTYHITCEFCGLRPRDGGLCRECPGRDIETETVAEAVLSRVLTAPSVWRRDDKGRTIGLQSDELKSRLSDLRRDVREDSYSLAIAIESRMVEVIMSAGQGGGD